MNTIKKYLLLLFLSVMTVAIAQKQEGMTFSGRIVSSYNNKPIDNAVINVTGLNRSVQSDSLGRFSAKVPSLSGELNVWADGYVTKVVPLLGRREIEVILVPSNRMRVEDMLAMPYGKDRMDNKSTNVNVISKENIDLGRSRIEETLYGRIPGLQVTQKGGLPGSGAYVNLRGVRSFMSESNPTLVVNGVPVLIDTESSQIIDGYSRGMFNSFALTDVANITLLKGADAGIYGGLGSNGVLLIETDQAGDLKTKVDFYGRYGLALPGKTMPTMQAVQFENFVQDMLLGSGSDVNSYVKKYPFLGHDMTLSDQILYGNNTDWQKSIRKNGFQTDNQVVVRGGDAIAKYNLSVGYMLNEGTVKNSKNEAYNTRLNSNVAILKNLNLVSNFAFTYNNSSMFEQGVDARTSPVMASIYNAPNLAAWEKNTFGQNMSTWNAVPATLFGTTNSQALVNEAIFDNMGYDINLTMGLNYDPIKDLRLSALFGMYYSYLKEDVFIPGVSTKVFMPVQGPDGGYGNNTVRAAASESTNTFFKVSADYNKTYNDIHKLNASAGFQVMTSRREYDGGIGRNTQSDFYQQLGNTNETGRTFIGYIYLWNWMNMYAKASYSFNNQLYVTAGLTLDGASSVGPNAPLFALLPSVSAAYNLKNTPMLSDVALVDKLTLRGEYVLQANNRFNSYLSKDFYVSKPLGTVSGIVRVGLPNESLRMEKTGTMNFGVDFGILNNRVQITGDYYDALSTDVVMNKPITEASGSNTILDNIAKISNKGVEVGLTIIPVETRNFRWTVGGSLAYNNSQVVSLGDRDSIVQDLGDGVMIISKVGESPYSFYGYRTRGVISTTEEAGLAELNDRAGNMFLAGDVRFVNRDGNSVIDESDKFILGSAQPVLFGGFFTGFKYKKAELLMDFTFSLGNKAYNATRRYSESMTSMFNQSAAVENRWKKEGDITSMPKATMGDPMGNSRFSDRWIEDASYLKLKNVTLSYLFDKNMPFIQSIKVFATGENLLTFTKYLGFDPEFAYTNSPFMQGIDFGILANPMRVSLGVNISF